MSWLGKKELGASATHRALGAAYVRNICPPPLAGVIQGNRFAFAGSGSQSEHARLVMALEAVLGRSPARIDTNDMRSLHRGPGGPTPAIGALVPQGLAQLPTQELRLPLPSVLYAILSDPKYHHIVSWMPHGRAWKIHDMGLFQTQIISGHFESRVYPNNFEGFIRLLKLWGFRQFIKGPDSAAFYHGMFARGAPELHQVMRPANASERQSLHDPTGEPNFYARRQVVPSSPPPSTSKLRICPVSPETPEMVALEGLRSLARGNPAQSVTPRRRFQASSANSTNSNLQIATELRDLTMQHLLTAKRVADHGRLPPMLPTNFGPVVPFKSPVVTPSRVAPKSSSSLPLPKSIRRKWLPPLGPSSPSSSASSDSEWYHTNPEAFASMIESKK